MAEPSLELLQTLMERMIETQRQTNGRLQLVEARLGRVERALLAGQRLLLDRSQADTEIQHQLDDLTRRVEAIEVGP
jgi:hypothetical protein